MSSTPVQTEGTIDLRQYLAILRARIWSIVFVTSVVVTAAAAFSYSQTPLYAATSQVLVQPIVSDPSTGFVQQVDTTTESQVVASEPVAEIVQEELGTDLPPEELVAPLRVEGIISDTSGYSTGARVLSISYVSADPVFAQSASNAFAEGYIEFRRGELEENLSQAQKGIETRIDAASRQLAQVTADLEEAERTEDDGLATTLETQRNILIARLGVLQQRLDDVQPSATEQSGGAQVLLSAPLPRSASSPNHTRNIALATFVGLILGIGLAGLRERLDNRFRGRDDVESTLQTPVLGTIPEFKTMKRKKQPGAVTLIQPRGFASEAYRSLRTNLEFTMSQQGIKSLAITSAVAGEGKTSTTMNLGIVLAQAGRRVIIVSADLRRPTIEQYFDVESEDGLSTLLTEGGEPWSVLKDPGIPNLRIIPSGPIPQNPAELLTTSLLPELIETLEMNCDVVLLDTPPALGVPDPIIVAGHVGGTLLIIDASKTHRPAALHAGEEIERAGGRLIGVAINSFDPAGGPYSYGSYYGSYYGSPYQSATNGNGEENPREPSAKKRFRVRR